MGNGAVQLDINQFYGVVGLDGSVDIGSYALLDTLQEVFASSFGCLATITIGDLTIAIFRNQSVQLYISDSHARDREGMVDPNGRCILLEFNDIQQCFAYLSRAYVGR